MTTGAIRPLWSAGVAKSLGGLALAREKGWVLVWDAGEWVCLLNTKGQLQGQFHARGRLAAACCADDGSALAAVGRHGEVWWLSPDLMIAWEQSIGQRGVAAAMDPFGQYLAVADAACHLHLFDQRGRRVWQVESPRPFHHLAFVPAAPFLIGSSDYGLVACVDLQGQWIWRDGLVAHVGALAVSGDGQLIVLACFTDGLHRYTLTGRKQERLTVSEPCRLATLTFDGQRTLVAGLSNRLQVLDAAGRSLAAYACDQALAAVTLGPLGEKAVVGLADGTTLSLAIDL